jgi:competence protein ComEC
MRRSILAYTFLLSFLLSVFVLQWKESFSLLPLWLPLALGAGGVIALLCTRRRRFALSLIACLLGIAAAVTAVTRSIHHTSPTSIERFEGSKRIRISALVCDYPDRRESFTYYTLCGKQVQTASGSVLRADGKVLAKDKKRMLSLEYGDGVIVEGTLHRPRPFNGFRYDAYLALKDIYATITPQSLSRVSTGNGSRFFGMIFQVKSAFEGRIEALFPKTHAAFLEGLLTGSRRGIPQKLMDDFTTTGLTHIIAISGFNITIILNIIGSLLFWLPLRWRLPPSLFFLTCFTLLVGASASVVRAAIMGTLGLFALQFGRAQEMRLTILWTLFFMLCWRPQQLMFDAGFQLSFLAVIGITELQPLLKPFCRRMPALLGIRDNLAMTLSANLFTMPWIMYVFGRFSLITPVSNLLVTPLIPLTMLLGFVSVCMSMLSPSLGQLLAIPAWAVLQLIILIVSALARVPFASLPLRLQAVPLIIAYAILCGVIAWRKHRRNKDASEMQATMTLTN